MTQYDQALQANLADPNFDLALGIGNVSEAEYPSIISASKIDPALTAEFDENLFVSKQQMWTLANGSPDGTCLDTYYNVYTKPAPVVMMILPKYDRKAPLQAVILTINEGNRYTSYSHQVLNRTYQNHHIWFVSSNNGAVLYGAPPSAEDFHKSKYEKYDIQKFNKSYNRLLAQSRFINGNIRKIIQKKGGIDWLKEKNLDKRMNFLKEHILPWMDSAKAKLYKLLSITVFGKTVPEKPVTSQDMAKKAAARKEQKARDKATQEAQAARDETLKKKEQPPEPEPKKTEPEPTKTAEPKTAEPRPVESKSPILLSEPLKTIPKVIESRPIVKKLSLLQRIIKYIKDKIALIGAWLSNKFRKKSTAQTSDNQTVKSASAEPGKIASKPADKRSSVAGGAIADKLKEPEKKGKKKKRKNNNK
jgi:hypothetical protein